MFKVGDKVRRIREPNYNDQGSMEVGDIGTVASIDGQWLLLEEYKDLGHGLVSMFELVKPEPQAAAIAGGLQEHSVGEYYPLAAVMYEHGGMRIITIENLQTGEVSAINGRPVNWGSFEEAYKQMESKPTTNWAKGRVSYVNDRWVVAEPANPVRVTRLRNMLHRG